MAWFLLLRPRAFFARRRARARLPPRAPVGTDRMSRRARRAGGGGGSPISSAAAACRGLCRLPARASSRQRARRAPSADELLDRRRPASARHHHVRAGRASSSCRRALGRRRHRASPACWATAFGSAVKAQAGAPRRAARVWRCLMSPLPPRARAPEEQWCRTNKLFLISAFRAAAGLAPHHLHAARARTTARAPDVLEGRTACARSPACPRRLLRRRLRALLRLPLLARLPPSCCKTPAGRRTGLATGRAQQQQAKTARARRSRLLIPRAAPAAAARARRLVACAPPARASTYLHAHFAPCCTHLPFAALRTAARLPAAPLFAAETSFWVARSFGAHHLLFMDAGHLLFKRHKRHLILFLLPSSSSMAKNLIAAAAPRRR